ncbi:hypothetical protein ACWOEQ_10970 [Enterococcus asini]|nr:hypothetical protein [Enterococcus asini]
MNQGTGKPLPLKQVLLMFYEMGQKLKKPPDCPQITQPGRQCQKGRVV